MNQVIGNYEGVRRATRTVFFRVHWLLGLLAGLVLALMGVTGAMMSFQDDLLTLINPGVMTVLPSKTERLSMSTLVANIQKAEPAKSIVQIRWQSGANRSVWVGFANKGKPIGQYVDPYTGKLLGKARGEDFFHTIEDLHRRLLAGNTGKAVTGAAAIILIVLALSGIYLRIKRSMSWQNWFAIRWKTPGRSRWYSLHSVVGTWLLLPFLVVALTGLFWSYDWYRSGVQKLAGASAAKPTPVLLAEPAQGTVAYDLVWQQLMTQADSVVTATLFIPQKPVEAVRVMYRTELASHVRALDTAYFNPVTGALISQKLYSELSAGNKLVRSMFALHSGEFFGLIGQWLMFFTSALMPLFFISGLVLYVQRRRAAKRAVLPRYFATHDESKSLESPYDKNSAILVGYASQTGTAEALAQATAQALKAAGFKVDFYDLEAIDLARLKIYSQAFFIVSTFGHGEPPDGAQSFYTEVMDSLTQKSLPKLHFQVLALGDRDYEKFCGFGHALNQWLINQGGVIRSNIILVNQEDSIALQQWQKSIENFTKQRNEWIENKIASWQLISREHINQGSVGGAIFSIDLSFIGENIPTWQAGDIAVISPKQNPDNVTETLVITGLNGLTMVEFEHQKLSLFDVLSCCQQPKLETQGLTEQRLADRCIRLPVREYSIASIPQEALLRLLVRQVPGGNSWGIGSGWLTRFAPMQSEIEVKIKSNPRFHPELDPKIPCVFIGNGTGLAGLRAHMAARAALNGPQMRNWLIFGERQRAHDFHWHKEWLQWQDKGVLTRLDTAFSRDALVQDTPRYVQHIVEHHAQDIRAWIAEGASVFVCGSAQGMAPAVDLALRAIMGSEEINHLIKQHRYRRDVY